MLGQYPSYQLPPQVQALVNQNRQPGTGLQTTAIPTGDRSMVLNAQQPVAPWQLTAQQQAAVSGSGPGMMPANPNAAANAAMALQQQQFAAGAQRGLEGGLGAGQETAMRNAALDLAARQGTRQYIPPQVLALANRGVPVAQPGVAQPPTQPVQQVRPDYSNMAGGLARGAYTPYAMR